MVRHAWPNYVANGLHWCCIELLHEKYARCAHYTVHYSKCTQNAHSGPGSSCIPYILRHFDAHIWLSHHRFGLWSMSPTVLQPLFGNYVIYVFHLHFGSFSVDQNECLKQDELTHCAHLRTHTRTHARTHELAHELTNSRTNSRTNTLAHNFPENIQKNVFWRYLCSI